jgi:hypothetical protein
MSFVEEQLPRLRESYRQSTVHMLGDGTGVVTVPDVPLPAGWNRQSVTAFFVVPVGFPMARPDCFWVDENLRLTNGGLPKNSALQTVAWGGSKLWFSWHPSSWNPNNDTLRTFVKVIEDRLRRPE